jgi:hypothetical protein
MTVTGPAAGADLLASDLRSRPRNSPCPTLHDFKGGHRGADLEASRRRRLPSVICVLPSAALRGRAERLARPGDHSVRAPPDPIPNSAVKPRRAQGTALLRVGERVVARSSEAFTARAQTAAAAPPPRARALPLHPLTTRFPQRPDRPSPPV